MLRQKKLVRSPTFAEDGIVAVETVARDIQCFDIIFMDNTMPNMVNLCISYQIKRLASPVEIRSVLSF